MPKFSHIEYRWGIIEHDSLQELDLIGEPPIQDEESGETITAAWFVQVKYRVDTTTKTHIEEFLKQIDTIQPVKGYAALTHWYVSKGGFTEPAKSLLRELGIYFTDLAQFNALAKEFGFLGFPQKSTAIPASNREGRT